MLRRETVVVLALAVAAALAVKAPELFGVISSTARQAAVLPAQRRLFRPADAVVYFAWKRGVRRVCTPRRWRCLCDRRRVRQRLSLSGAKQHRI
jgi:hypothetical protein